MSWVDAKNRDNENQEPDRREMETYTLSNHSWKDFGIIKRKDV